MEEEEEVDENEDEKKKKKKQRITSMEQEEEEVEGKQPTKQCSPSIGPLQKVCTHLPHFQLNDALQNGAEAARCHEEKNPRHSQHDQRHGINPLHRASHSTITERLPEFREMAYCYRGYAEQAVSNQ